MNPTKDFILRNFSDPYARFFRDGKYVDEHHLVTKLDNGMPIIVDARDRCVCLFIRICGRWDVCEKRVVDQIVKKGFKIIEVGSNFGVYTLPMAQKIGPQGHLYAFEANPEVSKYLKQSLQMNSLENVSLFAKAAGDKTQKTYISQVLSNIGGGHLVDSSENAIETEVVCLDDVILDQNIDLLKIDAEGYELKILYGARKLIDQNKKNIILMMEWSPTLMHRYGYNAKEALDFLRPYGFKFWKIAGKNSPKALIPLSEEELLQETVCDIVASHHDLQVQ